jgi:hypothetical protein
MSQGPQNGIFFLDHWNRIWFLRPSPVRVGTSVTGESMKNLNRPVIFNVTEFDTPYIPGEYRAGTVAPNPTCALTSSNLVVSLSLKEDSLSNAVPTVTASIKYSGPRNFVHLHGFAIVVFQTGTHGGQFSPSPDFLSLAMLSHVDCRGTEFATCQSQWDDNSTVSRGKECVMTIPLLRYRNLWNNGKLLLSDTNLHLPPGEYQIIAVYFRDYENIMAISKPVMCTIARDKKPNKSGGNPQPVSPVAGKLVLEK